MNEITITQTAGKVTCDFEGAKAYLEAQLNDYKGLVFTEATKKDAKATVAELRKQKKAFSENVSQVKNEYMKPYETFYAQAKELMAMFDEPINFINNQVLEFEEKRRTERIEEIKNLYAEIMTDGIEEYAPYDAIYNKKWENATTTIKAIRTEMEESKTRAMEAVEAIKGMQTDIEDIALAMYSDSQDLTSVISYINRHEQEKKAILEKEKERIKAEEEERIRAEERAKIEAEQRAEAEKAQAVEEAKAEVIEAFIPEETTEEAIEYSYYITMTPSTKEKLEMFMDSIGIEYESADELPM